MEFSERQKKIIEIVKQNEPISGDNIAGKLGLTKPTLRSDLAVLTMTGVLDARPKVGYIYSGQKVEPLLFEKLYNQPIEKIIVPPVVIKQSTTLNDAITDLFMYDVGSLYVVEDEAKLLVGVLSRKDLLRSVLNTTNHETPVAVMMTRMPNIITVTQDISILEAGNILMNHQIDSMPVVEKNLPKKVIGKITKTRIMNYFISEGIKVRENNEY